MTAIIFDVTQWPHSGITPFEEAGIEELIELTLTNDWERCFVNNLMNRLAACDLTVLSVRQRESLWGILGRHRHEIRDPVLRCFIEQWGICRESLLRSQAVSRDSYQAAAAAMRIQ